VPNSVQTHINVLTHQLDSYTSLFVLVLHLLGHFVFVFNHFNNTVIKSSCLI